MYHLWASNAFQDGASLMGIKDILGHTDMRTTMKYTHSDLEGQREVFKKPYEADKVVKF